MLNLSPGEVAVDLGAGDGQVVMAMARRGAVGHGYERDTQLANAAAGNLDADWFSGQGIIYNADFWSAVPRYRKIAVFQNPAAMARLERIFLEQSPPGTRVVSHRWEFPNLEPVARVGDVFLYIKGVSHVRET